MGIDFSHGEAHFGHGSFRSFGESLAAMAGIRLSEMEGFGGKAEGSAVAGPIAPLLSHNDAGGELSPEECRTVALRLEELMADGRNREGVAGAHGKRFWSGSRKPPRRASRLSSWGEARNGGGELRDFWDPELREAVQALIRDVEGKPCVNVETYDGGVYVCRKI